MRKVSVHIILLFFFSGTLLAQDLKKDLLKMNDYMNKLTRFQMNIIYSAGDTTDLKEEGEVSVFVAPEGLFYNMEATNIVINEQNTIMLDDEEHTVIYSDNAKTKKQRKEFDFQKQLLSGLDSLIGGADSVYFALNGTNKTYYLRNQDGYFNLIEIQFTGTLMSQIIYYYNPSHVDNEVGLKAINRIEVVENPTFDLSLLKTEKYYTIQNGTTVPTEEFKNYILIYNESGEEFFE